MSEEAIYRREAVLWRRTYDRVIVMRPGGGEFLTLQGTGCDLWAALDEPRPLAELAERLATAYETSVEQVAADLAPVLASLVEWGAVGVRRTSP